MDERNQEDQDDKDFLELVDKGHKREMEIHHGDQVYPDMDKDNKQE